MRNETAPKSGVRGVSWNSQFERWHVRVRVKIDGRVRYASFGLYDTVEEAAEVADRARRGLVPPSTYPTKTPKPPMPTYTTRYRPTTRPGTPPPDLSRVTTEHLLAELQRRGHP